MAGIQQTNVDGMILEDDELVEAAVEELGEEEECGMVTLAELTAGCDPDARTDVPKAAELCAAAMRQVELIVMRHGRIEETLDGFGFSFDWNEDADGHVEQQTALQLLGEAGELLAELRGALFRWLRCVGRSSVVQLDDAAVAAATEIIKERQPWRRWVGNDLGGDCLKFVAASPDAIAAVIAADDQRVAALDVRCRSLAGVDGVDDPDLDDDDEAEPPADQDADAAVKRALRAELVALRYTEPKLFTCLREVLDEEGGADHDESDDPAEVPVQPGRRGENATPANVQGDGVGDKVAVEV